MHFPYCQCSFEVRFALVAEQQTIQTRLCRVTSEAVCVLKHLPHSWRLGDQQTTHKGPHRALISLQHERYFHEVPDIWNWHISRYIWIVKIWRYSQSSESVRPLRCVLCQENRDSLYCDSVAYHNSPAESRICLFSQVFPLNPLSETTQRKHL